MCSAIHPSSRAMFDAIRRAKHFLPRRGVPAVARPVRPDLASFGKMDDVLVRVARPGHVRLPGGERRPDAVQARDDALFPLVDLGQSRQADAGHDPHVDHDVRRVGQLDADLRHRRADRPHAERQDVHRPPAHRPAEQLLELAAHPVRLDPVVGRPGRFLGQRADKRPVLDPSHVARVRPSIKAARPEILVQRDQGAARDHPRGDRVGFAPPTHRPSGSPRARSAGPSCRPTSGAGRSCSKERKGHACLDPSWGRRRQATGSRADCFMQPESLISSRRPCRSAGPRQRGMAHDQHSFRHRGPHLRSRRDVWEDPAPKMTLASTPTAYPRDVEQGGR